MLILSRDVNESICIGDDITVMVVDIRGGRVRLGVTAPGLKIHRQEIVEKIKRLVAGEEVGEDDETAV